MTSSSHENKLQPSLRKKFAPHICTAIILALNLAFYSKAAPTLRLVELTVCREYYSVHNPNAIESNGYVSEAFCKDDEIQRKVAWLFTLDELLHFCCGMSSGPRVAM